jgi:hypothetical protein
VAFPSLRFAATPREALTITHKLLLFVDPTATGGWTGAAASGRAGAAPGLESWAAELLGDPAGYPLAVRFDDAETGTTLAGPFRHTLAEVGLGALDLVFLASVGEETGLGRLGALLAAWAEGLRPESAPAPAVTVIETDQGDPSVDDLVLACRSLRRLVAGARDLDGRDLVAAGTTDSTSGIDISELEARVTAVRAALQARHDGLRDALPEGTGGPARGDVRAAMLALSGFHVSGVVPTAADADALTAQGQALLAQVATRLADLDAREAEEAAGWSGLDELAQYADLVGRLHLLVGHKLPVAPTFTAANGTELDATFGRRRLNSREAATGWLAAAGRVDPGARRLRVAVDMLEAARAGVLFEFGLGQLPDHPGEPWAAVERPAADEHGRLCLLSTGRMPSFTGGAVAGLVLGAWTEALPRSRQTAGVAFHFDAPSSRAPQAILLCTAASENGFDFALVRDSVKQTLDLARLRMVGPETLQDLGQYLPATYLHLDTSPGAPQ